MAIVQISQIRIRRGKKNAGSGLPQLASGELAWAIDSQQMYIGNGSVSEGAPAVGNTELLTEHTNVLDLVDQYQYKRDVGAVRTGLTSDAPVTRTARLKLDDFVT